MKNDAQLVSKVLILDDDDQAREKIRVFCESVNLVSVKVHSSNIMTVLKSNVDLGCIFIAQNLEDQQNGISLGRQIHALRPELPIFLRRDVSDTSDLCEQDKSLFAKQYWVNEIESLRQLIDGYIFSLTYPNALVRGITELTKSALESQFINIDVEIETPYIVRDRLIFGEVYSLIPIEGSWCRGYMMLQTEQGGLIEMIQSNKTHANPDTAENFRNINSVLGEITNLIWGAFKNRYISTEATLRYMAQVPIVINHTYKYISFGSENPQLCFKYILIDRENLDIKPFIIYQRFIFNLNRTPEDFSENTISVEDLVNSGELEMF